MARRYDSFLVRGWRHGDERRVAVEHLQSGCRLADATPADAIAWIGAPCGTPRGVGPTVAVGELGVAERRPDDD